MSVLLSAALRSDLTFPMLRSSPRRMFAAWAIEHRPARFLRVGMDKFRILAATTLTFACCSPHSVVSHKHRQNREVKKSVRLRNS